MQLKSLVVLALAFAISACIPSHGEGLRRYHSVVTGSVKVVVSGDAIFVRPAESVFTETPRLTMEMMRWISIRGASATKLEVSGVCIDEKALSELTKMKGLNEVVFTNTDFDDEDLLYVADLPNVKNLVLHRTSLTSNSKEVILGMQSLVRVAIGDSPFLPHDTAMWWSSKGAKFKCEGGSLQVD